MTTPIEAPATAAAPVAAPALTGAVTLVVGPKTRLGAEVIRQAVASGDSVVAVARGEVDEAVLAQTNPEFDVRRPDAVAAAVAAGAGSALRAGSARTPKFGASNAQLLSVRIVVCALGPVHTWQTEVDRDVVARDLASVEKLVAAAGPGAQITLVSSVIALAPGADRRSYGGWKLLIEHELRTIAERHGANLSVFYPGRLVEPADVQRPWHRLHTLYSRLAARIVQAGRKESSSKVVGLDARLWLFARGFSVATASVSGAGGSVHSTSEGHSTRKQETTP